MMNFRISIFAVVYFVSSLAFAASTTEVKSETYLTSAASGLENGNLMLDFELSNDISIATADVKFLRRTIEWDIKGVILKKDKIFLNVAKNDVNNVYVSQVGNNITRIRINLENAKVASNYHDRVAFSKSGKHLVLKFDNSMPLITNNITELNRVYDIESMDKGESKIASKLQETATLKISSITPTVASETAEGASALNSESEIAAIVDDTKSENEIPLITDKTKTKEAGSSPWLRIMMGVGVLCGLLLSVVVVSRKIQQKRAGSAFNHDSIKIVSQKYLGPKRCLTLVRVSGEYLLLGVTDHNISLVKSLSVINDELPQLEPKDFGSTIKGMEQKIQEDDDVEAVAAESEDKFTVSSLSDVKKILKKRKYIDEADV